ncbi:hypothetical protein PCASD_26486 [Puccinia coronata f. sp. avenae]|uniref:Large ribosomal subunit protein mL46 N-terminal domain-containing protein n=1 Tax=Puccinia coronata f. sp. avenae TaxID=200324 RepID=A0A2N5RUU0_9BASI|nr:hypothetical protein PCASD_26486 [Puccinia coronata f. sp. avenae]
MLIRSKFSQSCVESLMPSTRRRWPVGQTRIARASTDSQSVPSSSSVPPPYTPSANLLPVRPSTSKNPRPTPKPNATLAVAALLSRSPLLLRPLSPFEEAYYQYQRELHLALSKPVRSSFFFRPGSHAAKAFELSLRSPSALQLPTASDQHPPETDSTKPLSLQNLEREPHRSIYLLVKQFNPQKLESQWQLPTSRILPKDNLTQTSLRAVHASLGPNMDIWSVGKVPAAVYIPPSEYEFEKVWVMPQRILRGKPSLSSQPPSTSSTNQTKEEPNQPPQLEDFAWFTCDEIRDRVERSLWDALEPVLR